MNMEKWAIRAILTLVMFIACFNMVGALSMLVVEKQKDIAILKAMGANPSDIRKIFLLEGVLWSLTGGIAGIILGTIICYAQEKFDLIKLQGNFVIPSFPVEIQVTDLLSVICIVLTVGIVTAWYPSLRATKTIDPSLKST
jgi:lipoprotein-releasing system permease protein